MNVIGMNVVPGDRPSADISLYCLQVSGSSSPSGQVENTADEPD